MGEGGVEHGGETRRLVVGGNDDAQIERAWVGERGERAGRRWGRVRAVGLFGRSRHDGGRREHDEREIELGVGSATTLGERCGQGHVSEQRAHGKRA